MDGLVENKERKKKEYKIAALSGSWRFSFVCIRVSPNVDLGHTLSRCMHRKCTSYLQIIIKTNIFRTAR